MLCRHQQKERTRRPVIPKLTAHARLRQPPCDPPDLCLTPVSGLPDARLLLWVFNRYTRSVSPTDEHNNIISESGHRVAAALIARVPQALCAPVIRGLTLKLLCPCIRVTIRVQRARDAPSAPIKHSKGGRRFAAPRAVELSSSFRASPVHGKLILGLARTLTVK